MLHQNSIEFQPSGIWEKYDARSSRGKPGGGGEYVVQEGFGWTNGAIMDLINMVNREAMSARGAGGRVLFAIGFQFKRIFCGLIVFVLSI